MLARDIQVFSALRTQFRAYIFYMFSRYASKNKINTQKSLLDMLSFVYKEIGVSANYYVIDSDGKYLDGTLKLEKGTSLSDNVYYYETLRQQRAIVTDPYPAKSDKNLIITATYPIFDDEGKLKFVACIDIPLEIAIEIVHPSKTWIVFSRLTILAYSMVCILLSLIAVLLFTKAFFSFYAGLVNFNHFEVKEIFESTILLTLALAIFDLVKAIFEEEVLEQNNKKTQRPIHKTMIRFLGSIIIALAIEALMLVFKFTISDPSKIVYAVYLTLGVAMLLVGLSIYVKFAYGATNDTEND